MTIDDTLSTVLVEHSALQYAAGSRLFAIGAIAKFFKNEGVEAYYSVKEKLGRLVIPPPVFFE